MHLAEISRAIAPNAHAALVLDGAGYHVAADLVVPDNITLVPLPPYAPELNPVENVWEYLRGDKLSITVYDDYEHILDASCEAWILVIEWRLGEAGVMRRHELLQKCVARGDRRNPGEPQLLHQPVLQS